MPAKDLANLHGTLGQLRTNPDAADGYLLPAAQGDPGQVLGAGTSGVTVWTSNVMAAYPVSGAETAAGVTPAAMQYGYGDPRRYGAVGDGVTDDTVAVQAAITVGGHVHFETVGPYVVSYLVITQSNISITSRFRTTLKRLDGSAAANSIMVQGAVGVSNVLIEGFIFDHNTANTTAGTGINAIIYLNQTGTSIIRNNSFASCHGGGSGVNAAIAIVGASYQVTIEKNVIATNATGASGVCGAIYMVGSRLYVTDNMILNSRTNAIIADTISANGMLIRGNTIVGATVGGAIYLRNGAKNATICHNQIRTFLGTAILIAGSGGLSTGVIISDNIIDDNTGSTQSAGIALGNQGGDCLVDSNIFINLINTNVNSSAINVSGSAGCTISNNKIVAHQSFYGIFISVPGMRVINNSVVGVSGVNTGIQCSTDVSGGEIVRNYIHNAVNGVAVGGGAVVTNLKIRNNTFGTITSKKYAIGLTGTMGFQPELANSIFYAGAKAPDTANQSIPASGNASVALTFTAADGAPFNTASRFWAFANNAFVALSHTGSANAGMTVVFTAVNLTASAQVIASVNVFGLVFYDNYQA